MAKKLSKQFRNSWSLGNAGTVCENTLYLASSLQTLTFPADNGESKEKWAREKFNSPIINTRSSIL
jgi:hypothetical protein